MDWDQRYAAGDTPWERGQPAPPLVEYLEAGGRLRGRVLVPGCGLGHDARYLASQGCEALGVDLSPIALRRAARFNPPARGSVSYLLGDFLEADAPIPPAQFDWLFEHTCFCALPPSRRVDYVASAYAALKPGGRLLAILFSELDGEEGPPWACSDEEVEALFGPRFEIERRWKPTRSFSGRENEETLYLMRKRHRPKTKPAETQPHPLSNP